MDNLIISSSLIKALFNKGDLRNDICMKKFHALFFLGAKSIPTEPQTYGLYFETKALGSTAGKPFEDLPRKPNGEKTAVQKRLDDQVDSLNIQRIKNHVQIIKNVNTQVSVYKRWDVGVLLRATFDIFPTPILYKNTILPVASIDLKTTKDIDSDWGEFGWSDPESMDHTQLIFQNYILREFDVNLNNRMNSKIFEYSLIDDEIIANHLNDTPVFYWVFEYGTKMRSIMLKVNIDNTRLAELKETIRKTVTTIWEHENHIGWNVNPSYINCKFCPLNFLNGGLCKEAITIREI